MQLKYVIFIFFLHHQLNGGLDDPRGTQLSGNSMKIKVKNKLVKS